MTIQVVSGILVRNGRVLLTQRPASDKYAFAWHCPGGKIEPTDRSPVQALRREFREEIGVDVFLPFDTAPAFGAVVEDGAVSVSFYVIWGSALEPYARERQGIGWFTAYEMRALYLTPANFRCIDDVIATIHRSVAR